jgi:hypothetical protein
LSGCTPLRAGCGHDDLRARWLGLSWECFMSQTVPIEKRVGGTTRTCSWAPPRLLQCTILRTSPEPRCEGACLCTARIPSSLPSFPLSLLPSLPLSLSPSLPLSLSLPPSLSAPLSHRPADDSGLAFDPSMAHPLLIRIPLPASSTPPPAHMPLVLLATVHALEHDGGTPAHWQQHLEHVCVGL